MGNLLIHHLTFNFSGSADNNSKSLENFLNAGLHARTQGNLIHATTELSNSTYRWGGFYQDLVFSPWPIIKKNPIWEWLPQPLHQSLSNFFYQNPSGESFFKDLNHFFEHFANQHAGTLGCECKEIKDLDVFDIPTYESWKRMFYAANPEKYKWKEEDNDYLPYREFSDQILFGEIEKHDKLDKLNYDNRIGQTFHDEVMRHKGPELRAYAVKIGTQIAEANFYKYEEKLSEDEEKAAGAPRKIFSFLNRERKKIFISIDHAHGMFEYHDHKGKHIGEYKFDSSFNTGADRTHDLKTL